MTDRGTRVRWTTAALVAPTAAALFTGTTVWAQAHQPATVAAATAPAPAAQPTVDPVVVALRQAVDANTEQVARLRDTVATLQAQAAAIASGAKVPVSAAASSTRRSGSATTTSATTTSGTTRRSTSGTATTTRTSAPATHTTTSASAAK